MNPLEERIERGRFLPPGQYKHNTIYNLAFWIMFEHQDWTEVRFPNKSEQQKKVQMAQKAVSTLERKAVRELAKDDPDTLKVEKFEPAFVQKVIQARVKKGWKQPDLARALNEDVGRIQRLEQHRETYCPKLKAKLQNWLQKA